MIRFLVTHILFCYSRLAMLCATFPNVPVVPLTATASKSDVAAIKQSFKFKKNPCGNCQPKQHLL